MADVATVTIGGETRSFSSDVDENWVTQQVNRRRKDGLPVCVTVRLETSGAHVTLATPACSGGGGGGRMPNSKEQDILDSWTKHRLNTADFAPGQVVAFLKQLRKHL
jgi:hypothetical protein